MEDVARPIFKSPFAAFATGTRDDASTDGSLNGLRKSDKAILTAAEIAEALAVTTYTNIINLAPFFPNIPDDDQGYLEAARQEEMAHYLGVRHFTTADLRVTAARIMGIESDHRTLARVVGGDVAAKNGGPIAAITGLQGIPESIAPPNNNEYERTQEWTSIDQTVAALLPFVDKKTAAAHGFDTNRVFEFQPFTPVAPNPLGEFIGFNGNPISVSQAHLLLSGTGMGQA